ncbi:unnamed protein product [Symbiodinium sp. CCMP2592]|nr:unnamed protein product [Symbiodinium sp. CCMP2592]
MKRSAAVAGFIEIGDGTCRLELANLTVATTTTSGTTQTTSTTVPLPTPQSLLDQVSTGAICAHESKIGLTPRQLQSHMCYLQNKLSLTAGISGGWSEKAQELLLRWFAAPKKGAKSSSSKPLAIKDVEQPSSSKTPAAQASKDVEQPSSSKTLENMDHEQPLTENGETPLQATAESDQAECASTSSDDSSSSSSLPVIDVSQWGSEWHDLWQQTTVLNRHCAGSNKRTQALKNLFKSIYAAKHRFDEVDSDSS